MRLVTVGGQAYRVAVRAGTDAEATPLVLCNGIGASFDVLQPFVDEVPAHRTVVRFDVPGVGGSPTPTLPYSIVSLGCAVARLLDELGLDRFDVLGMSWGGALAQQLALMHPHRCRRLVLVSTSTGALAVPASPRVLARMVTPRRFRDAAYAREVAPLVYGGALRERPDETAGLLLEHLRLGSRRGYAFQLLAIGTWTSLPVLPLLRQPTLVLAGTDDPVVPLANARIVRALVPRSELVEIPDGHLALLTSAETVGRHVEEFLAR